MPRRFSCPECDATIESYVMVGGPATCQHCSESVCVPEDAIEFEAVPPPGASRSRAESERASRWLDTAGRTTLIILFTGIGLLLLGSSLLVVAMASLGIDSWGEFLHTLGIFVAPGLSVTGVVLIFFSLLHRALRDLWKELRLSRGGPQREPDE